MNQILEDMRFIQFVLKRITKRPEYSFLSRSDRYSFRSLRSQVNKFIREKQKSGGFKASKLALNEKVVVLEDNIDEILRDAVLKFGSMSIPYVMRELKCDHELARELIIRYSTHECCEWSMAKINALDVEFGICECLFSRYT